MPPISSKNPSDGLYFTAADLQLARNNREDEAIRSALTLLKTPPRDALSEAYLAALGYRFDGDIESGQRALQALVMSDLGAGTMGVRIILLSSRRSDGWARWLCSLIIPRWAAQESALLGATEAHIDALNHSQEPADLLRDFWLGALNMAAGIILDSADHRERAAALYRRAVDQHIHPEGYLKGIVDRENSRRQLRIATVRGLRSGQSCGDGGARRPRSLVLQQSCRHAHHRRHLYFLLLLLPGKMALGTGIDTRTHAELRCEREGAFHGAGQSRRHELHGIEQLLAEQRPFFCPWAGGLTTLTHGLVPPKNKRWRLW